MIGFRAGNCLPSLFFVTWTVVTRPLARPAAVFLSFFCLIFSLSVLALSDTASGPHVRVSLVSGSDQLVAGQPLELAIKLIADDGWHTYWKNPGDTGKATDVDWHLPVGFYASDIEWPVPERIDYLGMINYGYHGEVGLLIPISVPNNFTADQMSNRSVDFEAKVKWLVCKDVCIPGNATLSLSLPIGQNTKAESQHSRWLQNTRNKIPDFDFDVAAQFRINGTLQILVENERLPVFGQRPLVFVGEKNIVNHTAQPQIEVFDNHLLISIEKDSYLETPPNFLPIVLASIRNDGEIDQALEFTAKLNTDPAAFNLLGVVPALANEGERKQPKLSLSSQNEVALGEQATHSTVGRAETTVSLLYAIVLAFFGGFILNAMPCVFPVLSLKIVSLVESSDHSPAMRRGHGFMYSAGVIVSFVAVAGLLIALRGAGEQVGWGFQLQSPIFIAFLICLLFLLAMSMSGVIELGTSLQNLGANFTRSNDTTPDSKAELWQSFATGVLATVVATPCTAPFMGAAMGFALGQPVLVALSVFAVMGLGLAFPFLLIAMVPAFANLLPKPGNWMVLLKELLAFPLYLTVVWLLWIFSRQTSSDALVLMLVSLVLIAMALWLWRQILYREKTLIYKAIVLLILLTSLLVVGLAVNDETVKVDQKAGLPELTDVGKAEVYSPEKLAEALSLDKTVFVNMTADWCITCKLNERTSLNTAVVKQVFIDESVVYLKGDWTHSDEGITAYLNQFGRDGVPLYVIYKTGQEPKLLPQLLTTNIVIEALRQ